MVTRRVPLTHGEMIFVIASVLVLAFATALIGYILMAGVLQ